MNKIKYSASTCWSPQDIFWICLILVWVSGINIFLFHQTPLMEGDSSSYLEMSPVRAVTYPLFLSLLDFFHLPIQSVVWIQLAIYLGAVGYLFFALRTAIPESWLSGVIAISASTTPFYVSFHGQILTESFWMSLLVFLIGLVVKHRITPHYINLVGASFLVGGLVILRPVGWAFVPFILLVALYFPLPKKKVIKTILVVLAPLLIAVSAEHFTTKQIHGSAISSLFPKHIFAKAALIDADIPEKLLNNLNQVSLHRELEYDAASVREFIASSPDSSIRRVITRNYEVFFQYRFLKALPESKMTATVSDKVLMRTGMERISFGVVNYIILSLRNYVAQWHWFDASHPFNYQKLNKFIEQNRPLPFDEHMTELTAYNSALKIAWVLRPLAKLGGFLTGFLAIVGLYNFVRGRQMLNLLSLSCFFAIALHGYVALVALTGIPIPRYLVVVWPLMACSLGFGLAELLSRLKGEHR